MLLVDMVRIRGDPVLFVKHQDEGFSAGGLPAVLDYDSFADQASFRSRLNYHHVAVEAPRAGIYYVGVYNNDVYIKERASFEVMARWGSEPGQGFCSMDCNAPRGKCQRMGNAMPTCECADGFAGALCEGVSEALALGKAKTGMLDPGQWAFYRLTLDTGNYKLWKDGLVVDFTTSDLGHPVLILKRDSFPSMLENDYIFTSSQMLQGRKRFKLAEEDLKEGEYIFGIFNMDYYRHTRMDYKFMVSHVDGGGLMPFTPYMSIVLGVTVSLFLCLFMSICKRLIQRHGLFGHPLPEQAAHFISSGLREAPRRGVDREVVESFPAYGYVMPADDGGKPDTDDSDLNSEGLPSCSVCLCPYEEGEMMRRLPCGHEFHMKCIDQWLTQRTTCPMCRVALVSDAEAPPETEAAAGGDGVARESVSSDSVGSNRPRDGQGARVAPDSPPGTADSPAGTPRSQSVAAATVAASSMSIELPTRIMAAPVPSPAPSLPLRTAPDTTAAVLSVPSTPDDLAIIQA